MKRDTRSAYRARAAATERSIDEAKAQVKADRDAEQAKRSAEYAERTKPVPFAPEELRAARAVRTSYGWQRVLRVNAMTVTILGDFGEYRIPQTTVLEVKA